MDSTAGCILLRCWIVLRNAAEVRVHGSGNASSDIASQLQVKKFPGDSEMACLLPEVEMKLDRLCDSFAQAPAPTALLRGPCHQFIFANDAYLRLVGRDRQHLVGSAFRDSFPELDGQGDYELLDRVYQTGETLTGTEREVKLNRSGKEETIYIDFTCLPIRSSASDIEGILFQCIDVTERVFARARLEQRVKERTAELEQAHERLRVLEHNLMHVQEEERRRLGLELHDGAGQLLIALKWKLGPLPQTLAEQHPELAKVLSESLILLDELSQELHAVSHLLHPLLLDEAGLASALRRYIGGLAERSGLAVDLEIDCNMEGLSSEIKTTVFRIVQEALTNVHRHAKTKAAAVRLKQTSAGLRVQIQDQGRGIPDATSLNQPNVGLGLGIQGMRERIRQLKGQFDIASGQGGTTVTAVLPRN